MHWMTGEDAFILWTGICPINAVGSFVPTGAASRWGEDYLLMMPVPIQVRKGSEQALDVALPSAI